MRILTALLLFFSLSVNAQIKIATLDWTVAETLIALNNAPVAVGDKASYKIWVGKPALAENTQDLGLRLQPNKESLARLSVDRFINSNFFASIEPSLTAKAPVSTVNFYQPGDTWQNIENATRQIGELIEKSEQAEQLITQTNTQLAKIGQTLTHFRDRPVAIVQFIDTRHLRFYGSHSLFGTILNKLGLTNAWNHSGGVWGSENLSITALATLPKNTRLVVVKPHPANVANALKYNSLWRNLALAEDPLLLPAIWSFGALPSAVNFAQNLQSALLNQRSETW